MSAPMTRERLAEIRRELAREPKYALERDVMVIGRELLAEVDRLREALAEQQQISAILDDYAARLL